MARLSEIATDIKALLNRPDLYESNPTAGKLDISLLHLAVNTVIRNLTLEETFRIAEQAYVPAGAVTASFALPSDFQRSIALVYTDSAGNDCYEFDRKPHILATRGGGYANSIERTFSIFGGQGYLHPALGEADDGGVKLYYYRFLPDLTEDQENYFTRNFRGYLTQAGAVYVLKNSIQPRGDNTAIYDTERQARELKMNILQNERLSKGTRT